MKTHITTLNNMAGTASLAHRRVLKVAQSIGCHEMGLSFYPLKPDYAKEIDKRLDGIIAPLNYGDIVIFQYPSWIGVNYDESFVNKIKSYRDTKLIIFVQDIQKLILRLSDGGFGLIWDADEQALGLYMAAGIPVIVKKGLSCEKYVTDNEIGAAATDFEDVYRIAVSESEDKLSQYYANVKKLQNLFINGIYTRKLLLDTLIMCGERL